MALKFQTVSSRIVMDLRRERKSLLKVREQQQAELERIDAAKKRYDYAGGNNCRATTNNFFFL